jgi:hypothetical protein
MRFRLSFVLVLTLALVLVAGRGVAAERPVAGDLLRLLDPPRGGVPGVLVRAAGVTPLRADDPRFGGATLEIAGEAAGDGATGPILLAAAHWRGLGRSPGAAGFVFIDRTGTSGIRRVLLRAGPRGGTLLVSGRGSSWPYRITQPQGAIDVRLAIGAQVYCARFTAFARNAPGRVVARDAPPPAGCDTAPASCGDGALAAPDEECDDGNRTGGDGCSALCRLEDASAVCAGVPTASGARLRLVPIATGLVRPVHVAAPPLDPRRVFVVEQPGRVRVIRDGALLPEPFLAIEDLVGYGGERGLLSLALPPRYAITGRFFVYYTNRDGDLVIARYRVSADPDAADGGSGQVLLTIPHRPFANHNGGQLTFGPDGFLYAGTGDGGDRDDSQENAQDGGRLLGKLLRLDVDMDGPPYYTVPPTNPFVGPGNPLDELWATGLRNPWRFSFDRATGDLYIADVGQDAWEEVDVQPGASAGGENYGWDVFEARHCHEPAPALACPVPPTGFTMPVLEYDHGAGCSITGGFVYRGCTMPDLRGTYFYSDYCTPFVRTFRGVSGGAAEDLADRTAELTTGSGVTLGHVTSFGEDARGELYLAELVDDVHGRVLRIAPGQ